MINQIGPNLIMENPNLLKAKPRYITRKSYISGKTRHSHTKLQITHTVSLKQGNIFVKKQDNYLFETSLIIIEILTVVTHKIKKLEITKNQKMCITDTLIKFNFTFLMA